MASKDARRAQRDIDREKARMEREEAKVVAEIKKCAKQGNEHGAKVLAKQLVMLRKQKERLLGASAMAGSVAISVTAAASSVKMAESMAQASDALGTMNKAADPQKLHATLQQFQRHTDVMGVKEEMLDDALMDVFEADADAEDAVVAQVLDEVGVEVGQLMDGALAPTTALPGQAVATATAATAAAAPQRAAAGTAAVPGES